MLQILTPSTEQAITIQGFSGSYYWGLGAEAVLRACGLVSVCSRTIENVDNLRPEWPILVLRQTPIDDTLWSRIAEAKLIFEAPINPAVAARLGITEEKVQTLQTVSVLTENGRVVAECPRVQIRSVRTDKEDLLPQEPLWHCDGLRFSTLNWPSSSSVLDCDAGPLVKKRERQMVLAASLIDLAGRWLSCPPIPDSSYAGFANRMSAFPLLRKVLELIFKFILAEVPGLPTSTLVLADSLPVGYKSSLTIRHDYDRDIKDESCKELLNYYDRRGIKASIGFLGYRCPVSQMRLIAARGHEIQLHAATATLNDFLRHTRQVEEAAGLRLVGFTSHGGPSGIKYAGDRHFSWAEAAGFSYADPRGPRERRIVPILRIKDGLPYVSPLLSMPNHFSLDTGTAPEANALSQLRSAVPNSLAEGEHVVIMNHPDIHRMELFELLNALDLSDVWCVTMAALINYRNATAYRSLVEVQPNTVNIYLPVALNVDAGFSILQPSGRRTTISLTAGSLSACIKM